MKITLISKIIEQTTTEYIYVYCCQHMEKFISFKHGSFFSPESFTGDGFYFQAVDRGLNIFPTKVGYCPFCGEKITYKNETNKKNV